MASIFKYTSIVLFISLVSKTLGLLRDILLVGELGAGSSTDVFYGAMNIIEFFILFSGLNAMKSVGTSTYTMTKKSNENIAVYLTSLILIITLYSIFLSFIVFSFSHYISYIFLPGFDEEKRVFATKLIRILSLMIFSKGLSLIIGNLMGVEKKFVIQSIFMPITNLIVIFTIILSPKDLIVTNMAFAILGAWFFSAISQVIIISDFFEKITFISKDEFKKYGSLFFRTGYPLLFVTTTFALASSTDKIIASFFKEGTITSINLANMICFMPLQLILVPISNVFFPHFSELYHAGKNRELEKDFNKGQLLVSLIFIPVMTIFLFWGQDIVEIAFMRKNFSQENLLVVSKYLLVYCFALILNSYYTLTTFLYQGAQKNGIIGKIGIIGYAVNIVCSVSISYFLKDPIGIPLGTVCAFLFFSTYTNFKVKYIFKIKLRISFYVISFIIAFTFVLVALFINSLSFSIGIENILINSIATLLIKVLILFLISGLFLYILAGKQILSRINA